MNSLWNAQSRICLSASTLEPNFAVPSLRNLFKVEHISFVCLIHTLAHAYSAFMAIVVRHLLVSKETVVKLNYFEEYFCCTKLQSYNGINGMQVRSLSSAKGNRWLWECNLRQVILGLISQYSHKEFPGKVVGNHHFGDEGVPHVPCQ